MTHLSSELASRTARTVHVPSQIGSARAHELAGGGAAAVASLVPAWNSLAERAIFPALQTGAAWTGGMMQAPPSGARAPVLLASRAAHGELTGLASMQRSGPSPTCPLPILRSWDAPMMFSGTPLIDARAPDDAVLQMLTAARETHGARALLFRRIETDSPLREVFATVAGDHGLPLASLEPRDCAGLKIASTFEEWFDASFPRKRRKEFRRLRARLSEIGRLESRVLGAQSNLEGWIEDFLALEQSGWKGRRGTAIGCDVASARFLHEALGDLKERGELMFWKLTLDNRPIAMLFGLVGHGRGWLVKMAYDEDYARFSPGVLVTLDATQSLMGRGDVAFVDSCAVPNHPMIDHLWQDRLAVEDVLIATPGTSSAAFGAILAGERACRNARATAKTLYHRFLSWKDAFK